jgi:hypothetical protein
VLLGLRCRRIEHFQRITRAGESIDRLSRFLMEGVLTDLSVAFGFPEDGYYGQDREEESVVSFHVFHGSEVGWFVAILHIFDRLSSIM